MTAQRDEDFVKDRWIKAVSTSDLLDMLDEFFVELEPREIDAVQRELASRPSIQWLLSTRGERNRAKFVTVREGELPGPFPPDAQFKMPPGEVLMQLHPMPTEEELRQAAEEWGRELEGDDGEEA